MASAGFSGLISDGVHRKVKTTDAAHLCKPLEKNLISNFSILADRSIFRIYAVFGALYRIIAAYPAFPGYIAGASLPFPSPKSRTFARNASIRKYKVIEV